jgi:hypothetical protein
MADLNNYDRPILTDNYADCLDTLRENIKRVKSLADTNAANQLNYVLKAGDTLSGNLLISRAGGSGYGVYNASAGTDFKRAWTSIEASGEIRVGGVRDDSSSWTRGIGIRTDGTIYNILTGSNLITTAEVSSGYLPITGGTLTGTLGQFRDSYPVYSLSGGSAHSAGAKRAQWVLDSSGTMSIGKLNDAGNAWTGGIMTLNNNSVYDIRTGQLFWHAGNDGAGSGLDADVLGGYGWSWYNNGNTHVTRHASGRIEVGDISTSRVVGGNENCGTLNSPWGYALRFHWDGTRLYISSNNGGWTASSPSGTRHSWGDPTGYVWFDDGTVLQWIQIVVPGDGYQVGNWPVGFAWCQSALCTILTNRADGQNNTYASHVLWYNNGQVACGMTDAGLAMGNQMVRVWGIGQIQQ